MLLDIGQTKHSATWGGVKSSAPPTDSKGAETQPARKRSSAKRMGQFLLCFGLLLSVVLPASAKDISKHLSPELYKLYTTGDPNQSVDVIVQYKAKLSQK